MSSRGAHRSSAAREREEQSWARLLAATEQRAESSRAERRPGETWRTAAMAGEGLDTEEEQPPGAARPGEQGARHGWGGAGAPPWKQARRQYHDRTPSEQRREKSREVRRASAGRDEQRPRQKRETEEQGRGTRLRAEDGHHDGIFIQGGRADGNEATAVRKILSRAAAGIREEDGWKDRAARFFFLSG